MPDNIFDFSEFNRISQLDFPFTNKLFIYISFFSAMLSMFLIKSLSGILLAIITLGSGIIPFKSENFKQSPRLLSISNAFAGGIFLSIGMVDLMPEAQLELEKYYIQMKIHQSTNQFPLVNVLVICSFSLLLLIQRVILGHSHGNEDHDEQEPFKSSSNIAENQPQAINLEESVQPHSHKHEKLSNVQNVELPQITVQQIQLQSETGEKNQGHKHSNEQSKKFVPLFLLVALGIHSFFEGLAIGIISGLVKTFSIMVAVVAHKWAEGLALGIQLKQADYPEKISFFYLLILSTINPFAVVLGYSLQSIGPLITAIFESISVGTFIFIATTEIIEEEFNNTRFKYQKYFFYVLSIIFVIAIWFLQQELGIS